ncbi:S1 family peptidase [uncultured Bdellovibrio sp.]|uniref:S1 family peptidase n=1 Tax=Bdellovibrio sp. HCB-162 TaxID=3394234 RepID=UPI0025DB3316|nr:serine protease [uncultured Bdellovibrio sp.]
MKTKLYVSSLIVLALTACGGSQSAIDTLVDSDAIVGGKDTTKDNVISKYVVLIYDNPTKTYCTGLLIKKDVILTAAHCVGADYKGLTLAFGLKPLSGDYVMRSAAKTWVHDKYKKSNSADRNDIALILIKGNAPDGYQTLLLPDSSFPLKAGYTFTAAGYGRISGKKVPSTDTQGSGFLRNVDLKIDSMSANESQFYVDQKSGQGICSGDSGGPALMRYQGKDYVVGIASAISWSVPSEIREDEKKQYIDNKDVCAEKSIYMNVKQYRTWIDDGLKKLLN